MARTTSSRVPNIVNVHVVTSCVYKRYVRLVCVKVKNADVDVDLPGVRRGSFQSGECVPTAG